MPNHQPVTTTPHNADKDLVREIAQLTDHITGSTLRAYRKNWIQWAEWCEQKDVQRIPADPDHIAQWLNDDQTPQSVRTRSAYAIRAMHRAHNLGSPIDHPVIDHAIHQGSDSQKTKQVTPRKLQRFIDNITDDAAGRRDQALILIGFAGAFRRSKLVAINIEDCTVTTEGLRINNESIIPYADDPPLCPVTAFEIWNNTLSDKKGPLFRPIDRNGTIRPTRLNGCSVSLIIKRAAKRAGLDPDDWSGDSLSIGGTTTAQQRQLKEQRRGRQAIQQDQTRTFAKTSDISHVYASIRKAAQDLDQAIRNIDPIRQRHLRAAYTLITQAEDHVTQAIRDGQSGSRT